MKLIRTPLMSFLCVAAWGCGGEVLDSINTETSGLESTGLPTGTTCGLTYRRPGSPLYGNNYCWNSDPTLRGTCPASGCLCIEPNERPVNTDGFTRVADGDRGLPACNGFYHYRLTWNLGRGVDSRFFRIPKGTACGFKEACNNPNERCLGFDANVSCPAGWERKVASDIKAPSGCGFVWCEYQDPNNLCTTLSCTYDNQPDGLICGITDNDRNNGQCMGTPTTQGCPLGYNRYGFFDDGRSPGHGVGWCAKESILSH